MIGFIRSAWRKPIRASRLRRTPHAALHFLRRQSNRPASSTSTPHPPQRKTVDLTEYPDLVVIYLGMRVNRLTGIRTLLGFGPKLGKAVQAQPDGLLLHENIVYSLFPPHIGMREYWRDFESMENWARSDPHRQWWRTFLRNSGGTGFWHESYFKRGGMEAVYVDVGKDIGFLRFAPQKAPQGSLFSSRGRAGRGDTPTKPAPVSENDLYR